MAAAHRPFRFAPPPPGPHVFVRPRLLEVLADRWEHRLIAIEAGPGFGKTTLAGQAVADRSGAPGGRDVWLTCEPADDSASTLVSGLLTALGRAPVDDVSGPGDVCEAVWARAPEAVCFVLDDAHHLAEGSAGAQVVEALLEDLPANGHLVVAGRSLAAIGRARLLSQHRAIELGEEDLRLHPDEVARLAAAHGTDPTLLDGAAGWPALAELWAATGLANAERFVWEEVISGLAPATRQDFVLAVAVGGGRPDMLETAFGHPVDLAELGRLPLVSIAADGSLEPHPLWEELLRDHLRSDAARDARRRMAAAFRASGEAGRAYELLAASGDWEPALEAVFDACNDPVRPPWPDVMDRWRRSVPPEHVGRAEVAYLDALLERSRDAWSPACRHAFARAIAAFQATGDVGRELTAAVRASFIDWLRGDLAALEALAERGAELGISASVGGVLALNEACRADVRGDVAEALSVTGRADDVEPRLAHIGPLIATFAHLLAGDGAAAGRSAEAARAASDPVTPAAGTGWGLTVPAAAAWMGGDLEGVQELSPGDLGARFGLAERVPAVALACVVAAHTADRAGTAAALAALDAIVPDPGDRDLLCGFVAVARATAAVAAGDEAGAKRALDEGLGSRPLLPSGAGRAVVWFPAVPFLFHQGSRRFLEGLDAGPDRVRALRLCAALEAARRGQPAATDALPEPGSLVTVLPIPLATELVVRASVAAGSDATDAVRVLAGIGPEAVRDTLGRLGTEGTGAIAKAVNGLRATVAIAPPHTVRIEVLGPSRLLRDGAAVEDADWRRERVRHLLLLLVVHRQIRRERLGVELWPEADETSLSANLRMTLSYLQGILEPHRSRGDAPWFLRQEAGVLRLDGGGHLTVDLWEFEELSDRASRAAEAGAAAEELADLLAAVSLWRGDPLEDAAVEEWAQPVRDHLRGRLVRGIERAGALLLAVGRTDKALDIVATGLGADPWAEPLYRIAAWAHLARGDRPAARRTLEACRKALLDLGVEPDSETSAIERQLGPR